MEKKLKVYIASPYTKGWSFDNVRRQLKAKDILLNNGFTPFAPLMAHFYQIYTENHDERQMMGWELEWLNVCDFMVRLRVRLEDGSELSSFGSDEEESKANEWGIPIYTFWSLEELEYWAKNINPIEIIVEKNTLLEKILS